MNWINKEKGGSYTKIVRFRHMTSGLLLTVVPLKNPDGSLPPSKDAKYVLTLGDGITVRDINRRVEKIKEIELENQYNMDFNPKTNPDILK